MRRETLVIGVIVALVLLPMWYVALQGEPPSEEVEIDRTVSEIRPLDGFLDTPNKLSPSQVGVIVWVALFALVGVLVAAHRFMNAAVRPTAAEPSRTDGGSADDHRPAEADVDSAVEDPDPGGGPGSGPRTDGGTTGTLPWFHTEGRSIVEYAPASESAEGIVVMGALTVLAIVFSALFTGEYLTLARTQYFGVYAAGLFLSLAALTVAYYAWFMPHVQVAERRGH